MQNFDLPIWAQSVDAVQLETKARAYAAAYGDTLAPARTLVIDGRRMTCGPYPTVLNSVIKDFGEAYPGFVILNPRLFAGLATPIKLWIFSHECYLARVSEDKTKARCVDCAVKTAREDEIKSDCDGVQRGRREGWLNPDGLTEVCQFIFPTHADRTHLNGAQRCAS